MTLSELHRKDVIQLKTGENLGRVDDLVFSGETAAVERLILRGGVGRIQIHGVPDYNYAEVTLAPTGKIQCSLVRIDPFPYGAKAEDETEEPVPDEQFNPQVWFKMQGQTVLEDIIADLSSRGHTSLEIHEDGSITVQDEDGGNAFPAFSSFPSRVHWPQVLRALERAGYAADENGDTISVNW